MVSGRDEEGCLTIDKLMRRSSHPKLRINRDLVYNLATTTINATMVSAHITAKIIVPLLTRCEAIANKSKIL